MPLSRHYSPTPALCPFPALFPYPSIMPIPSSMPLPSIMPLPQHYALGIKYGDPVCASETIYLGGNKIRWESSVCHLGNYFDTKFSDMIDSKMKCSSFIVSVN